MKNKYGIPEDKLAKIRDRDLRCVYCQKEMFKPSKENWSGDWATIEHFNNTPPWNNPETVAICCGSCNSSRGQKLILEWFKASYCKEKNICPSTVSKPVIDYISKFEGFPEIENSA